VSVRELTVVGHLEGVLALGPLSPAAHGGEGPVLVARRVSMRERERERETETERERQRQRQSERVRETERGFIHMLTSGFPGI